MGKVLAGRMSADRSEGSVASPIIQRAPTRAGSDDAPGAGRRHRMSQQVARLSPHQNGKVFMRCACEAGTPTKGQRVPMVCKHMAALVLFKIAVRGMRRAASH